MKRAYKRILDLKKHGSQPLIIQRQNQQNRRNILQIKHSSTQKRDKIKFDLHSKKSRTFEKKFFLTRSSNPISQKFSRLKFSIGALVIVLILNFIGIFGAGKQTFDHVISTTFSGLGALTAASESFAAGNFSDSANRFAAATRALRNVEEDLLMLSGAGTILETQPEKVQAGSRLISTGKLIASGGEKFATAANEINIAVKSWRTKQKAVNTGHPVESFTDQLTTPFARIISGITDLENAAVILALVDTQVLPANLAMNAQNARDQLDFFLDFTQSFPESLPNLLELLGCRTPRKYLILFQNIDEIRPTGGFIGSVGVLTLNDGFSTNFEIRDVYSLDGQLTTHLDPPDGFGIITSDWGLRDSNYHPDFPTSAAAAAWLFEEAGGGTVDGVAAINSSLLTSFATISNGIQLERFTKKIEAQDLNQLLSLVIETKIDGAAAPKQILKETWMSLQNNLTEIKPIDLANIMLEAIAKKDVQFWSPIIELEQFAESFNAANKLAETKGDYLFVVNTSLSGNKSDRYTHNKITHETSLNTNGTATNLLKIKRTHAWSPTAEQHLEELAYDFNITLEEPIREILGRGRNIDLVKVFVPLGSQLIEASGISLNDIKTHKSMEKTYFMFSLTTEPGTTREVILKYQLPQKFTKNYSFLGEQQSGDKTQEIEKIVQYGDKTVFKNTLPLGMKKDWSW